MQFSLVVNCRAMKKLISQSKLCEQSSWGAHRGELGTTEVQVGMGEIFK